MAYDNGDTAVDATTADDVVGMDDAALIELIRTASTAKPRSVSFYAGLVAIGTENIERIADEAAEAIGKVEKRGRKPKNGGSDPSGAG